MKRLLQTLLILAATGPVTGLAAKDIELLNVSYDPTREFYQDVNQEFAAQWQKQTGDTVTVSASHGGSGKQARAVIDGLAADVVTLALSFDIDAIADKGKLLAADWQSKRPNRSAPYTSTIVFLVRKGNPKAIKDWQDLANPGLSVITPNPKTSGGARWNYLAAWAWAKRHFNGDEAAIKTYLAGLFANVPILDTGARGSTTTFASRRIGDVLISWENEAHLVLAQQPGQFEIIVPSLSILAEPPVALVDKVVDRKGTRAVASAYLDFLYSDRGQQLAAKHHFRPSKPDVVDAALLGKFPALELVQIDQEFGGWAAAQKGHFAHGGSFDQVIAQSQSR